MPARPDGAQPPGESAERPRSGGAGRGERRRRWLQGLILAWAVLSACFLILTGTERGRKALAAGVLETPVPYAWAAGRADNLVCSWWQAAQGLRESYATMARVDRLRKSSRRIRTDEDGHQLWETSFGPWWYPRGSREDSVLFSLAQYELAAYPGLEIRRGDVVLDCGGFVGDWAHWVLKRGAARVIVFEPAEAQIECIRRNLAGPLQEGRVVLIPKGVWDRDEQLTLTHWEDNPAGHSVVDRRGPTGETIPLTTIDAVVQELGLQRLDVIKMDVEGAEVRALRGARETLNRFRPRLAVATEHTSDFIQNNRDVIATVSEIAPFYRHRCGYCRMDRGRLIIPETLYFDPR